MYTSDIKTIKPQPIKTAFIYLLVSIFCVLFGAVYEYFSHEVYSGYMIYAFVFPLVGGTLPFFFIGLVRFCRLPGLISLNMHHTGIATLTLGSLAQGVLEIYGTDSSLIKFYWIVGIALIVIGTVFYFLQLIPKKKSDTE